MEVKNQYKYVLTDRFGVLEVAPIGEGDFSISNEQDDDGKYFYSKVFNGKIMFTGATYARLKKIEKSIYLCTQQRLQVYRLCGDDEVLIFDGYFKLSEGDWNDEFCTVVLKFQKILWNLDSRLRGNDNANTRQVFERSLLYKQRPIFSILGILHFWCHPGLDPGSRFRFFNICFKGIIFRFIWTI